MLFPQQPLAYMFGHWSFALVLGIGWESLHLAVHTSGLNVELKQTLWKIITSDRHTLQVYTHSTPLD